MWRLRCRLKWGLLRWTPVSLACFPTLAQDGFVQVVPVKVVCKDADETMYVCQCCQMQDARQLLMAAGHMPDLTAADLRMGVCRCVHSLACEELAQYMPSLQGLVRSLAPVVSIEDVAVGDAPRVTHLSPRDVVLRHDTGLQDCVSFFADDHGTLACSLCRWAGGRGR